MAHWRFCLKICKLGERTTTSYMHYTIKGLDVPRNPKITAKIQTQNAEDLEDTRLYVIKADKRAGEEEKYKEETQGKKRKRLHVMSSAKGFFSHAPSPTLSGWFLILRFTARGILLVSDAALCICSA